MNQIQTRMDTWTEDKSNGENDHVMLELFQGTRSISRAFERNGWKTYSVELDTAHPDITYYGDVYSMTAKDMIDLCGGRVPDVLWASPVCDTYSVAQMGHHRYRDQDGKLRPRTEFQEYCDTHNAELVRLITQELKPRYWFIENPRQAMRVMDWIQGLPRYTITYCQYGDTRQKPTDIWTNHPDPRFKPPCKPGSPCHVKAPRGTRNGTQGLKDKVERARIPDEFQEHIVEICGGRA